MDTPKFLMSNSPLALVVGQGDESPTDACFNECRILFEKMYACYGLLPSKVATTKSVSVYLSYRNTRNDVTLRIEVDNDLDIIATFCTRDGLIESGVFEDEFADQAIAALCGEVSVKKTFGGPRKGNTFGGHAMSTVQKWGNSLAVRIPSVLAGQLDVGDGTEVELTVRNGELVVRPVRQQKRSLRELLKDCKPTQLHGETDFGEDVGREVQAICRFLMKAIRYEPGGKLIGARHEWYCRGSDPTRCPPTQ